jgi:hypothetical protein
MMFTTLYLLGNSWSEGLFIALEERIVNKITFLGDANLPESVKKFILGKDCEKRVKIQISQP